MDCARLWPPRVKPPRARAPALLGLSPAFSPLFPIIIRKSSTPPSRRLALPGHPSFIPPSLPFHDFHPPPPVSPLLSPSLFFVKSSTKARILFPSSRPPEPPTSISSQLSLSLLQYITVWASVSHCSSEHHHNADHIITCICCRLRTSFSAECRSQLKGGTMVDCHAQAHQPDQATPQQRASAYSMPDRDSLITQRHLDTMLDHASQSS